MKIVFMTSDPATRDPAVHCKQEILYFPGSLVSPNAGSLVLFMRVRHATRDPGKYRVIRHEKKL